MPLLSNSCTQVEFAKNMETLMHEYKTTGKIGNTTPKNMDHAKEIALAMCYDVQRECRAKRKKR